MYSDAAYVFFPLTILPKLYTITYLVILLCTPPPGAAQSATTDTSSGPAWLTYLPSEPASPADDPKDTILEVSPAPGPSRPPRPHPGLLPHVLTVRPDWISIDATRSAERTVRSRSWSDSTFVGSADVSAAGTSSPTGRVRGRLGSEDTLAPGSPRQAQGLPKIKVEGALEPIAEVVDAELEYYRSYAAALEASRTPRTATFEHSPSVATFPMIEHPYARRGGEGVVKEIEMPVVEEEEWDETPAVKRPAGAGPQFDADECLAKYKFGTLKVSRMGIVIRGSIRSLTITGCIARRTRSGSRFPWLARPRNCGSSTSSPRTPATSCARRSVRREGVSRTARARRRR